jgi:hypothetical protein
MAWRLRRDWLTDSYSMQALAKLLLVWLQGGRPRPELRISMDQCFQDRLKLRVRQQERWSNRGVWLIGRELDGTLAGEDHRREREWIDITALRRRDLSSSTTQNHGLSPAIIWIYFIQSLKASRAS